MWKREKDDLEGCNVLLSVDRPKTHVQRLSPEPSTLSWIDRALVSQLSCHCLETAPERAYCLNILDLKDGNQLEAYALGSLGGDLNDVSLWPRQSTLDVVRIHFCVQGLVLPSFPKVPLPNERQSKCGGWTTVSWIAVDIMAASNTSCFFPRMSALNAPCLISHVSRSYLARLCGPDLDSWGV